MCGIAGFSGSFPPELLDTMGHRIAHRGPDDAGSLLLHPPPGAPPVGLAHRRLSILDLSPAGHQPMMVACEACGVAASAAESDRLWLVYNGELYNFAELHRELESHGHRFHSRTDSEVLLHLYAERGPAMLERLNGMFALAIYDGRPNGQKEGVRCGDVVLARDGLGIKPLYYAETRRGVVFASELKALLAAPDVSRDLDPVAIHHYLAYLWAPAPGTPLRAVRKLEPGAALLLRDGHIIRRWTHYELPYEGDRLTGTEAEVAERLAVELGGAIDRQTVADVPIGAFLSGGLDSSAIVALMRARRPDDRLRCYTIGFEPGDDLDGFSPDLPYARQVATHLGLDLEVIDVRSDVVEHLEELLYHLDEPQADPAPLNAFIIARHARRDGIKVLMSGVGGDDIFTGYRRHVAVRHEPLWSWLPLTLRRPVAVAARAALDGRVPGSGMDRPWARRVARLLAFADLEPEERLATYYWWSGERLRRSLYSPILTRALENTSTDEPLRLSLARLSRERDPIQRMLYLDTRHFLADHNLNYTDKTSMAAGIEVRVPLLDREVVRLAASIPPAMKQRGRIGKMIFRRAMEPLLPRAIVRRPKTGFGAPLRRWIRRELAPTVDALLSRRALLFRGLFDPPAVRRLIDANRAGRVDGSYLIFSLLCLELWCRIFIDGGGASPGARETPRPRARPVAVRAGSSSTLEQRFREAGVP